MRLCHQRSRRVVAGTRCDYTARPTIGIVSFNSQLIVVSNNADRTSYEQYIRRRPYILQLGNPCGLQFCRPRPHTVYFGIWLRSANGNLVLALRSEVVANDALCKIVRFNSWYIRRCPPPISYTATASRFNRGLHQFAVS